MAAILDENGSSMDIRKFLSPSEAIANVAASDKTRLLNELCLRAAQALRLDASLISSEILKREELGSTGVGAGIAIPHARIANVEKPFGVLARLRKPIDFNAIDAQPVDIVFLLLLPATPLGEQLTALAAVARKLRDPKTVGDLRRATDNAALFEAMMATGNA
jgi:PTS system nitrogen regulatory IIA component